MSNSLLPSSFYEQKSDIWNALHELTNIENQFYTNRYTKIDDFETLIVNEHQLLSFLETQWDECLIERCSLPSMDIYIASFPHSDIVDIEEAHITRLTHLYHIKNHFVNHIFHSIEPLLFSSTINPLQTHLANWIWNHLIKSLTLLYMIDGYDTTHIRELFLNFDTYYQSQFFTSGGGLIDSFASLTKDVINSNHIQILFEETKKQLSSQSSEDDIYNIYVMEHCLTQFISLFPDKYDAFMKLIEGLQHSTPMFMDDIKRQYALA